VWGIGVTAAISEGRSEVIDAFRGVAILSVMAYHYLVRWAHPSNVYGYHRQLPVLLAVGHLGVQLFFVISGLVITMTVLRSRDTLEFCTRRFARLYPAFIVGLALTFVVTLIANVPEFKTGLGDVFANLTMDAPELHHKMIDGAYWSLSVEIKFYALVAICFAVCGSRFWIAIASIALLGLALAHYVGMPRADRLLVAGFMPFFLAGMGAWFLIFEKLPRRGMVLLTLGFTLYLLCASDYNTAGEPQWLDHVYLGATVGLMFTLLRWAPTISLGPLAWIGRISYSLYLIHQYIGVILIRWLITCGAPDLAAPVVATLICIAIGVVMFKTVEEPGKRLVMKTCAEMRRYLNLGRQLIELR
jgi:peptidoglycan/LPS O-acetylase OafA/YrhL